MLGHEEQPDNELNFDNILNEISSAMDDNPMSILYDVTRRLEQKGVHTGRFMGAEENLDILEELERRRKFIVSTELGEESYLKYEDGLGNTRYCDLGEKQHWKSYLDRIKRAHYTGDHLTLDVLLGSLPEEGQLKELATVDLEPDKWATLTDINEELRVKACVRGRRFDLRPGVVDFQEFLLPLTRDGKDVLDHNAIVIELTNAAKEAYASGLHTQWELIDETLENIQIYYGEEAGRAKRYEIWGAIEAQLRIDAQNKDF